MLGKYFRVASSLVNPASIAGVKAWWRASDIAQSDNSAVVTWTDAIGGIAPTQATSTARPTYRTAQGPNGRPAVSFDGGDYLTIAGVLGSQLVNSNQCHFFIVQNQNGADPQNTTFAWNFAANNLINTHLTYDDVLYWDYGDKTAAAGNGRVNVAQPAGWDNSWRLVQLIRDTSNNQSIRDQGSQLVTASRSKTITTSASGPLYIGVDQAVSIFFTGFITDILIYNVALSTTDRQNVEAYFNALYSLF